jgi:hypothetical protein
MKAKLLRIVRKRYQIYKYPNGMVGAWFRTDTPTLVLKDGSELLLHSQLFTSLGGSGFYVGGRLVSEQEAIKDMKKEMLERILKDYSHKGVRRIKHQQIRKHIYYNENNNPK